MMKRVFDLDVTVCPGCEGQLKVIAVIQKVSIAREILRHEGLYRSAPVFRSSPIRPPRVDWSLEMELESQLPPEW